MHIIYTQVEIPYAINFADVESVLQRMTIIGVLLSFRSLAQEALLDVCNYFMLIFVLHYHFFKIISKY